MSNMTKTLSIFILVVALFAITACGGGTASTVAPTIAPQLLATDAPPAPPTVVPPTAAPTNVPPTLAPTNVPATAAPVPPTQAPVAPTVPPPTTAPTTVPPTEAPTNAPTAVPPTVAAATVAPQVEPTAAQALAVPTFIAASEWTDPSPDKFTREDVDYIFPPGRGQDLLFQACTSCHNWVPMIMAGYDRDAWTQNKLNHRERAMGLSDADYDYLYEYLVQTWPPSRTMPDNIPQDLLDQWTSY